MGFNLPFRALGGSLARALTPASSLELRSKVAPLPRTNARPLPGASSLRAGGTTTMPCSAFVVSHHLDGLLRVLGRGLVASHTRTRVHHVSCVPSRHLLPKAPMVPSWHSPQRGSYPPKSLPRQQPYCITAAVALLPFRRHNRPRSKLRFVEDVDKVTHDPSRELTALECPTGKAHRRSDSPSFEAAHHTPKRQRPKS